VVIPARTPAEITKTLEDRLQRVVADPQVHDRLRALGASPANMSAAEAVKWLQADRARWSKLIADYNIRKN
jgi:tripartite-type tricarboxylate transporter receptor subunit TctC